MSILKNFLFDIFFTASLSHQRDLTDEDWVGKRQDVYTGHGKQLFDRNIVYVPDFVVNAGGMMGASTVIFSKPDREKALANIEEIFTTVIKILERSRDEGKPSADIAEEMAVARIRNSA